MCGICGYFGEGIQIDDKILGQMNSSLFRRGPDDGGMMREPGVGLAMRRLSIIDVQGGHQPIHNEDKTVWVVFNGEIYNYKELRSGLQERGHVFMTNSDTEVLVHLYEEYGEELVHKLRGMFAFALWDAPRKRGMIARDRIGIKPLFYADSDGTLLFGSEIKALLASGRVRRDMDYQALDAYFAYTYIPAPLTIYSSIRKLEAGHVLIWEAGRAKIRQYWDINVSQPDNLTDWEGWAGQFDRLISDSVASHMVSDVPIGAFLSGGMDSSLVVALMSGHASAPVETFTMGFKGGENAIRDERSMAEMVANRYGCAYHEGVVDPALVNVIGEIVNAFDEPFADDSVIPTYYVSRFARQGVKVAMSGLGGDELFGGYQRYAGMLLSGYYGRWVPQCMHRKVIEPIVRSMPEPAGGGDRVDHAKRFAAAALEPSSQRYLSFVSTLGRKERENLFTPDAKQYIDYDATEQIVKGPFERCEAPDDVMRSIYTDLKTYVPEDILALSDRLSMWHSLEVRVPLVDHNLIELSARMPSRFKVDWRRKKILLREMASSKLPSSLFSRRKQGFEAPMAAWLRKDLSAYAQDLLGPKRLGRSGLFDVNYVESALSGHLAGKKKNSKLLFSLLMFEEWLERSTLSV